MTEADISAEIAAAERAIEALIGSLEGRIGRTVLRVDLDCIGFSTISGDCPRFMRSIRVLAGEPGHGWSDGAA